MSLFDFSSVFLAYLLICVLLFTYVYTGTYMREYDVDIAYMCILRYA